MTPVERTELAAMRDELRADIAALKEELLPALRFYQQASGVLAVLRWAGPTVVIGALAGAAWLVLR